MNTIYDCYVPMRDGVKLYTIVRMPEEKRKYPTVILRNPYLSADLDIETLRKDDTYGYAILIQQCRGTARSQGECNPYLNERNDGLDLLEWVRQQPFYNGEIYLLGSSYCASVHFSYLDTDPPDVKGAFLAVQDTERYNVCYRNGFFKPGLHGDWVLHMHKKNQAIERNCTIDTFRTMPLKNVTESVFNERVPYIEESFLHPDPADGYWKTPEGGSDFADVCNRCRVPILLATAFYDIYAGGVMDMWRNLTPERRKDCAIVVTPFDHSYSPAPDAIPEGMEDFRDALLEEICPAIAFKWFDHIRKGAEMPFVQKGKMVYYRLWDHKWITAEDLVNAPCEKLFFLTDEKKLADSPAGEGEITYTYNPYDPAKFEGGVCHNFGGMKYQAPPNSRYDILSFLSEEITGDRICEGGFELELHCRSTAEDTCFYVRLDLVRDGKALSLRDDIDSLCRVEKEYTPGEERVLRFRFVPHAFALHKGDRLRLDVSSSCVPYFQVHTNQKGLQALQTQAKTCRNTVITGRSFLRLFTRDC